MYSVKRPSTLNLLFKNPAAFREQGPKWRKLSLMFKGMGLGYPKSIKVLKRRYEDALLSILHQQITKNRYKPMGSQGRENGQ
jgi:hypothetical protein